MKPEETIDRKLWWMLQKIKAELFLKKAEWLLEQELRVFVELSGIDIASGDSFKIPTIKDQQKILRDLESMDILSLDDHIQGSVYINVDTSKFSHLYENYENRYGHPSTESNPETSTKTAIERQVQFTDGGDIIYDKNKITNAKPKSIDFYFLQILFANFNETISYERLAQESQEKYVSANNLKGSKNTSTPQEFCQQKKTRIKSGITNESHKELFDRIIEDNKTITGLPGYRMTNP